MSDRPATGRLVRESDVSGVSGTGHVADVVAWPDGSASVRWLGQHPSIVFWERSESVAAVHGHGGATRIVWDNPTYAPADFAEVERHVGDCAQGEIEMWDHWVMREALWKAVGHLQPLMAEVGALRQQMAATERGRTPAAAHHRQPYPTVDAYERACAALGTHRARADDAEATVADLRRRLNEVDAAIRRAGIEYPLGAAGVDDLAAQRDGAREEQDALREALGTRKEMHEETRAELAEQRARADRELAYAASNWRGRLSEAADILDVAGHHGAARLIRQHAGIPQKAVRSTYADLKLPVPLEDRHRDALATIALTDPGAPETHAAALIDLAREALALDTRQETP